MVRASRRRPPAVASTATATTTAATTLSTTSATLRRDANGVLYAISSDLIDKEALNTLIRLRFDATFTHVVAQHEIAFPSQARAQDNARPTALALSALRDGDHTHVRSADAGPPAPRHRVARSTPASTACSTSMAARIPPSSSPN